MTHLSFDQEVNAYYNQGREEARLSRGSGKLEYVRTQEILHHHLPHAPAVVIDVGGGAGVYAFGLAERGYHVHLIDAMPIHIEQAQRRMQAERPLASASVGDARHLEVADHSADAVMMLGPLYHLTEREERLKALHEAFRVLKPGGVLFAVAISRFASFVDAVSHGFLADPYFVEIMREGLISGQHRNPERQQGYFSTAFFHHPHELRHEVEEAHFTLKALVAVEGLGSIQPDFDNVWEDIARRETLLEMIRRTETEETLLGASPHIMAVAHKPSH